MPTLPTHRLALAVFASALLAIASAPWALGLPALNFVFKPLTTLLIIALAWRRGRGQPAARRWVLAGLLCSLCGEGTMTKTGWPASIRAMGPCLRSPAAKPSAWM